MVDNKGFWFSPSEKKFYYNGDEKFCGICEFEFMGWAIAIRCNFRRRNPELMLVCPKCMHERKNKTGNFNPFAIYEEHTPIEIGEIPRDAVPMHMLSHPTLSSGNIDVYSATELPSERTIDNAWRSKMVDATWLGSAIGNDEKVEEIDDLHADMNKRLLSGDAEQLDTVFSVLLKSEPVIPNKPKEEIENKKMVFCAYCKKPIGVFSVRSPDDLFFCDNDGHCTRIYYDEQADNPVKPKLTKAEPKKLNDYSFKGEDIINI